MRHSTLFQGLSHYLEHMLFMGSEKYPDENEYDSFLASHGGSSNAFTEMVRTIHAVTKLASFCALAQSLHSSHLEGIAMEAILLRV